MRGMRLCLGLVDGIGLTDREQIALLKKIGFDGFFCGWAPGYDLSEMRRAAEEEGMIFQSVHAPFSKMAAMWKERAETEEAVQELIDCVRACAENGVDLMVAHPFIGFEDHEPTEFGLANYGKVVREAANLGVKVAFENVEGEEYLFALMDAFRDEPNVGFCWDTGHQMCYNPGTDMMARYGDRLMGTHLNDNLGVRDEGGVITWLDDLHLLPFDGIADWKEIVSKISRSGFSGPLTFELGVISKPDRHENDPYRKMDAVDYLHEVYKRACRVGAMALRA